MGDVVRFHAAHRAVVDNVNVRMKTISIRELHLNTGRWVRHAAGRGPVVVTDRGRCVAALQPFDASVTGRPLPNREATIRKPSLRRIESAKSRMARTASHRVSSPDWSLHRSSNGTSESITSRARDDVDPAGVRGGRDEWCAGVPMRESIETGRMRLDATTQALSSKKSPG
jgi:antitoxin (DNA-binding transcriptional repressor) of toxin-antitoxin stability system